MGLQLKKTGRQMLGCCGEKKAKAFGWIRPAGRKPREREGEKNLLFFF
jgi:hypothetical protein